MLKGFGRLARLTGLGDVNYPLAMFQPQNVMNTVEASVQYYENRRLYGENDPRTTEALNVWNQARGVQTIAPYIPVQEAVPGPSVTNVTTPSQTPAGSGVTPQVTTVVTPGTGAATNAGPTSNAGNINRVFVGTPPPIGSPVPSYPSGTIFVDPSGREWISYAEYQRYVWGIGTGSPNAVSPAGGAKSSERVTQPGPNVPTSTSVIPRSLEAGRADEGIMADFRRMMEGVYVEALKGAGPDTWISGVPNWVVIGVPILGLGFWAMTSKEGK